MHCQELCERLDNELETAAYADIDASANGLQVGSKAEEIVQIAFAVDAAVETIERAIEAEADMLVTHHGISWGGIERVTGKQFNRIEPLIRNEIALYTSHLPLDGHQQLGNAAGVGDLFELEDRSPFGSLGGEYIGQCGTMPTPTNVDDIEETLQAQLDTGEQEIRTLDFGPSTISEVAIVTGSGVDWLDEAIEKDIDAFITGEGKQKVYHEAREAGINVFLAGHYATETFGVESLRNLAATWGLETSVIDCPTGL